MKIHCIEIHRYAPELNKIHTECGQEIPAPGITTIEKAEEFLSSPKFWSDEDKAYRRKMALRACLRLLPVEGGEYGWEWRMLPDGIRQAMFRLLKFAGYTQLKDESHVCRSNLFTRHTLITMLKSV